VGLVTVKLSTGGGRYTIRRTPEIRKEHISPFVDPQSITSRVQYIRDTKWNELSQEQREAVEAFFHMIEEPSGSGNNEK
jgi:hypothetical protein